MTIRDTRPMFPIVVHYNDINIKLAQQWKSIIMQNNMFKDFKLITAFCNNQNLRKQLVRSSLLPPVCVKNTVAVKTANPGSHRCASIKCKACEYIVEANKYISTHNNRAFTLSHYFSCKSTNVVYLVTCKRCSKQYVGETGRQLSDRINQHLSCIRLNKPTPIGLRFNYADHTIKDFSIIAIEQFKDTTHSQVVRRAKEITWQNILQTAFPLGINNLKIDHLM